MVWFSSTKPIFLSNPTPNPQTPMGKKSITYCGYCNRMLRVMLLYCHNKFTLVRGEQVSIANTFSIKELQHTANHHDYSKHFRPEAFTIFFFVFLKYMCSFFSYHECCPNHHVNMVFSCSLRRYRSMRSAFIMLLSFLFQIYGLVEQSFCSFVIIFYSNGII